VVELATGSHSESDLLLPAPVDGFLFSCHVLFGQSRALIEHRGVWGLCVILSSDSVPPSVTDHPVSLAKEHRILLESLVSLKLAFDVCNLFPGFTWESELGWAVTVRLASLTFVTVQALPGIVELLDIGSLRLIVLLPLSLKDCRFTELFLHG